MKCLNHPRRNSISINQLGIPPLCRECWDREGQPVNLGDRVIATDSHPFCSGTVRKLDDGLVVVDTLDGGEAWTPVGLLVAAN